MKCWANKSKGKILGLRGYEAEAEAKAFPKSRSWSRSRSFGFLKPRSWSRSWSFGLKCFGFAKLKPKPKLKQLHTHVWTGCDTAFQIPRGPLKCKMKHPNFSVSTEFIVSRQPSIRVCYLKVFESCPITTMYRQIQSFIELLFGCFSPLSYYNQPIKLKIPYFWTAPKRAAISNS